MKKFLLALVLLVIVGGVIVPQFFLDKAYAMDRSTPIRADPAEIVQVVSDIGTWDSWTAWNSEKDSTLVRTFTGAPGTVGHASTWTADDLGNGSIEITAVEEMRVAYRFQAEGFDPADGAFVLSRNVDGSTNVRWEMSGEITGFPTLRYFGLLMDSMVGPDFESGLQALKKKLEGGGARAEGGE